MNRISGRLCNRYQSLSHCPHVKKNAKRSYSKYYKRIWNVTVWKKWRVCISWIQYAGLPFFFLFSFAKLSFSTIYCWSNETSLCVCWNVKKLVRKIKRKYLIFWIAKLCTQYVKSYSVPTFMYQWYFSRNSISLRRF